MNEQETGAGGEDQGEVTSEGSVDATLALAAANQLLLERLREALLASAPEIDAALVKGESLGEIEESFAVAKATVERVRESVRKEMAPVVPAGSLVRTEPRPASAIEKIREGLSRASR